MLATSMSIYTILNTHVVFPSIFMLVSSTRQIFISAHTHTNFSINEKLFYGLAALWSVGLNFRFDDGGGGGGGDGSGRQQIVFAPFVM